MPNYSLLNNVRELIKKPTSGDFILNKLNHRTNLISYGELNNYSHIDDIFKYNSCVILIETKENTGHWICALKHPSRNSIELFDSYSGWPDDQLNIYIPEYLRKKLGEDYPLLTLLLYESGYNAEFNDKQLQKKGKDVCTCGYYCVLRILFKHLDIDEYDDILLGKKYTPDELVIMYVMAN